ncbi:MAG: SHOCT domain-containing protein [Anaerolineales bacterium]
MNDIRWRPVAIFAGVLLLAVLIVLGLIWATSARVPGSNGELIYFRGINDRGERITYRGNLDFTGPGMMMDSRLSCASCHGQQARGGVHMMHMQVMDAPDIRWSVLAGEVGGEHADEGDHDDEHAEAHAGYDLVNFRMAVVEGKHPNGEPLSAEMPRWEISNGDLEDLAEFLRSPSLTEKGVLTMPGDLVGSGGWIIFPIIGIIVMMVFMFMMMGRRGGFMSRRDDHGRSRREPYTEADQSETPLSILKSRYAKGEISKEEYEEMKSELQ